MPVKWASSKRPKRTATACIDFRWRGNNKIYFFLERTLTLNRKLPPAGRPKNGWALAQPQLTEFVCEGVSLDSVGLMLKHWTATLCHVHAIGIQHKLLADNNQRVWIPAVAGILVCILSWRPP